MLTTEKWAAVARKYPWTDLGNGNFRSPVVRLSYADLFVPKLYKGKNGEADANAKPRYGVTLLLPVGDTAAPLVAAMAEILRAEYGAAAAIGEPSAGAKPTVRVDYKTAQGAPQRANAAWPLVDQGEMLSDGYVAGSLYLPAYTYEQPKVVDTQRKDITDPGKVYSGSYAFVTVRPYWSKTWDRICIGLQGVQFLADGERFGGGAPAVDAQFEDVAAEFAGMAADNAAEAASLLD